MNGHAQTSRVYVDTSVIGGCLEDIFQSASNRLIERCRAGAVSLVISEVTIAELTRAPVEVRGMIDGLPEEYVEYIYQSEASDALAEEYIRAQVVSRRMLVDAQHIALATVARVDVLVSWNFKHIVNLDRIRAFNAVNLRLGYTELEIRSPQELWKDDDEID
jgi:predicted nucleic acid-binding protein